MPDLVRAVIGGVEKNVGRSFAESHDLEVLDEPTRSPDGRPLGPTRRGGRPAKRKTTVAKEAAAKKAVTESADNKKETDQ